MNTILQKRIEEAAGEYYDISLAKKFPSLNEKDVESDIKASFYQGATFALQNQWISVEEALPDYYEKVLVRFKQAYGRIEYCTMVRRKPETMIIFEKNGFNIQQSGEVTHWMLIPKLKDNE